MSVVDKKRYITLEFLTDFFSARLDKALIKKVREPEIENYLTGQKKLETSNGIGIYCDFLHMNPSKGTDRIIQGVFFSNSDSIAFLKREVDNCLARKIIIDTLVECVETIGIDYSVSYSKLTGERRIFVEISGSLQEIACVQEFGTRFRNAKFTIYARIVAAVLEKPVPPLTTCLLHALFICGDNHGERCFCTLDVSFEGIRSSKEHKKSVERFENPPVIITFKSTESFQAEILVGGNYQIVHDLENDKELSLEFILKVFDHYTAANHVTFTKCFNFCDQHATSFLDELIDENYRHHICTDISLDCDIIDCSSNASVMSVVGLPRA